MSSRSESRGSPATRSDSLALLALLGVVLAVVFATATIGAVRPWARVLLAAPTLLAFVVALAAGRLRGPETRPRYSPSGPEWFLLGLVLLGLLQLLPLPPALHRLLSPEAAYWMDRGFPSDGPGSWRTLSLYPWATRLEVFRLATLLLVFSIFARGFRRRGEPVWALGHLVGVGGVAALVALVEHFSTWGLFEYYPRQDFFPGRLAGPFVNPNHFAGFLEILGLSAMGLYLAVSLRHSPSRSLTFRQALGRSLRQGTDRGPAVVVLLAITVMAAALLLTASRLGVFSFLVGIAALAILVSRGDRPGPALAVLSTAALLFLVLNAGAALDPVLERWTLFFEGQLPEGRVRAAGAVFDMFTYYPLAGSGLGTFRHVFPGYQPVELVGTWPRAHNGLLQVLADGGLLGAALTIGLFASWFRAVVPGLRKASWAHRNVRAGAAAATIALLFHSAGDFNLQIPGNAYLLTAVMGIGYGAARLPRRSGGSRADSREAAGSTPAE